VWPPRSLAPVDGEPVGDDADPHRRRRQPPQRLSSNVHGGHSGKAGFLTEDGARCTASKPPSSRRPRVEVPRRLVGQRCGSHRARSTKTARNGGGVVAAHAVEVEHPNVCHASRPRTPSCGRSSCDFRRSTPMPRVGTPLTSERPRKEGGGDGSRVLGVCEVVDGLERHEPALGSASIAGRPGPRSIVAEHDEHGTR